MRMMQSTADYIGIHTLDLSTVSNDNCLPHDTCGLFNLSADRHRTARTVCDCLHPNHGSFMDCLWMGGAENTHLQHLVVDGLQMVCDHH